MFSLSLKALSKDAIFFSFCPFRLRGNMALIQTIIILNNVEVSQVFPLQSSPLVLFG